MKKVIALVLVMVMSLTMVTAVWADVPESNVTETTSAQTQTQDEIIQAPPAALEPVNSGTCGVNAVWSFNSGILTVEPEDDQETAAISDFESAADVPWQSYAAQITTVEIISGVVRLGDHAFEGLTSLTEMNIPLSVEEFGYFTFANSNNENLVINYAGSMQQFATVVNKQPMCALGDADVRCAVVEKNGFYYENGEWTLYEKDVALDSANGIYWGTVNSLTGYFYVEDGTINMSKSDINVYRAVGGPHDGEKLWWWIQKGSVVTRESIERNGNGWWYVNDGYVDFTYNGCAENAYGLWKLENGKVTFSYKGFGLYNYEWYYFDGSKAQLSYNGIVPGEIMGESGNWLVKNGKVQFVDSIEYGLNNWWKITGGKTDPAFIGFAQNSEGWWYIKNGKVQFDVTSIIKGNVDGETAWWYVRRGKVRFETTVERNELGWWYVEDGKVDFTYNGIATNGNGTWRIKNGKVDFDFNGFDEIDGEWYYFVGGKLQNSGTDIVKGTVNGETAWWYIKGGKVEYVDTIARNGNGWWKVENGKVNFNFTGFASNDYGWWYLKEGKVRMDISSVIRGNLNGTTAWWHVVKGEVVFDHTVAKNEYGWWKITDGQVHFGFTGLANNEYGWWYIRNGQVDFNYNGVVNWNISGDDRAWTVVNGKVATDSKSKMIAYASGYESKSKYLIMIDCSSNYLGVFEGKRGAWNLKYYWKCTTGAIETPTKKGVFALTENYGYSFSGPNDTPEKDYTCYYYSGFASGGYLIHSILYRYNSFVELDPRLGSDLSHGCVRLSLENAKWIYDNCAVGTTVVTYPFDNK